MVGAEWLFAAPGPGATNHFEAGGFARSNDEVAYPNLMFHFLPIAIRYDGSAPGRPATATRCTSGPMYSDARGSVQDQLADPGVHPALRFNYLSTDEDRREWVEAIRVARADPEPARLRAVQRRRAVARPRGRDRRGDPGLGAPRRRDRAAPVLHLRMGIDDDGGARPARACACTVSTACGWSTPRSMPYVTNGNIYAPVMMLAEKAADLILGNTPLEPDMTEYYRRPAVAAQSGD